MPIPKPNDGEGQDEYISRCMGDEAMQEYDSEQRLAVCRTAWDDAQKAGEDQEPDAPKAGNRPVFERKSFSTIGPVPNLELKLVNADEGIWEAYASTFKDSPDPYGDIVDKGAFKKTIRDNFKRIRNLWNHNVDEPIGRPLALSEDSHGLHTKNKLSLGVQRARETRELMADGVINEVSIGFDTIMDKIKDGLRHLVEVRLWDISPVTYAANEEAVILSVKNDLRALRIKGLPDELLRELLNLPPDISPEELKQAIAAIQALRPGSVKGAVPGDTPDAEAEAQAAELESAMAELSAFASGFDARAAARRIDELLAGLEV
jgi:uncharacterized protein